MPSPQFHSPDTVTGAIALLSADPSARPLSGGTDLIVQMRSGRVSPGSVVDLKRIKGLQGITRDGDVFVIGAATPCTALKADRDLVAAWPGVVEAANLIGSVQVRNRATMAGNLCNASPAADSVPALVAAGAIAVIAGPQGVRRVPVEDIPVGPGKTSLSPGEFVYEFRLRSRPIGSGDAYLRSTPRTEMDIAVVGVGVNLVLDGGGICTTARIALGAVGPKVVLADEAAAALIGTALDHASVEAMAEAVRAASSPIDDKRGTVSYRKAMAGVLARRAVAIAAARAGEAQ